MDIRGMLDIFTDKKTQDKISEYFEKYGEVLLGMHKDIVDFDKKINTLAITAKEIDSIISSISNINSVATSLIQTRDKFDTTATEVKNSIAHIRESNKTLSDHIASSLVKNEDNLQKVSYEIKEIAQNVAISIEQSNTKYQTSTESLSEMISALQEQNKHLNKRINFLTITIIIFGIGGLLWIATH